MCNVFLPLLFVEITRNRINISHETIGMFLLFILIRPEDSKIIDTDID